MGRERAPGGDVQLSCNRKSVGLLKRADGVAEVVAVQAIDFAGPETGAVQQDLGPGD